MWTENNNQKKHTNQLSCDGNGMICRDHWNDIRLYRQVSAEAKAKKGTQGVANLAFGNGREEEDGRRKRTEE